MVSSVCRKISLLVRRKAVKMSEEYSYLYGGVNSLQGVAFDTCF